MLNKLERTLKILLILNLLMVAFVIVAFYLLATNSIIFFDEAITFKNARSLSFPIHKEELDKLDYFQHLEKADFRKSIDYKVIANWVKKHPNIDVLYTVPLPDNITFTDGVLNLKQLTKSETFIAKEEYIDYLENIEIIQINVDHWSPSDIMLFQEKNDAYTVDYDLSFTNTKVEPTAQSIDVSQFTDEDFLYLEECLPLLTNLKQINFGKENGHMRLDFVSSFHKTHPSLELSYSFSAFGKEIDFFQESLDFSNTSMQDDHEVREILNAMPNVKYLDMDSCGLDDEMMANLRDSYPHIEVIWRIWFGTSYSVRTDVTKILASAPYLGGELTVENTQSLKYCTKVKYLDIGHNQYLHDVSFVSYMPDLEVLIIMWGNIQDITPLKNCPHLEFLEIFTNDITDLSPLANLKELKHLNLCWNPRLSNLQPIYSLTQLERLWIGIHTSIPAYQIDEFQALAPNCIINRTCSDPHTNWRWGNPRYELLKEQLGYTDLDYQLYYNDPLYKEPE